MNKKQALIKAIELAGGVSETAKKIGTTKQAVSNWKKSGLPAERVIALEEACSGLVTRNQLRPDLYPASSAA